MQFLRSHAGFLRILLLTVFISSLLLPQTNHPVSAQYTPIDTGSVLKAGTTITVNSILDVINYTDGLCTLREAIITANANRGFTAVAGECTSGVGTDHIIMPAGTFMLTIPAGNGDNQFSGDLDILDDLTITGAGRVCATPGEKCTIVKQNIVPAIRIFQINEGVVVNMSEFGIYSGREDQGWGGGGIYNAGTLTMDTMIMVANSANTIGGAIYNTSSGTATISTVGFANNSAENGGTIANYGNLTLDQIGMTLGTASGIGGCIWNAGGNFTIQNAQLSSCSAANGGAIFGSSTISIANVTIKNSSASTGSGGGIYVNNTTGITNVTFSGNTAGNQGGGIFADKYARLTLLNSTLSENTAVNGGGGVAFDGSGDGFLNIKNTINTNNCNGPITSLGHNIDTGSTCGFTETGDLQNTNPLLGPLEYGGAEFDTHALLTGSPAIDAGDNQGCPTTDERGIGRPKDGNNDGVAACDIGAYEYHAPKISVSDVTVTEGNSGENFAIFTISLDDISFTSTQVDYQTIVGSAGNTDFDDKADTLTIPAKALSRNVSIPVYTDLVHENDEIFYLQISNPVNASLGDSSGVCTIINDDNFKLFLPLLLK